MNTTRRKQLPVVALLKPDVISRLEKIAEAKGTSLSGLIRSFCIEKLAEIENANSTTAQVVNTIGLPQLA
jgi:hypothetical protein